MIPPFTSNRFPIAPDSIKILFNEPIDSQSVSADRIDLLKGPAIASIQMLRPDQIVAALSDTLRFGEIYEIKIKALSDCAGNTMAPESYLIARAQQSGKRDLIINEILANPVPYGSDYIEIFNRSNKTIDLSELWIADSSSADQISTEPLLLFPNHFMCLTEDRNDILMRYQTNDPSALFEVNAMPNFPDDEGTIVLRSRSGLVIDQVDYNESSHFDLLHDSEGVALERIDPESPSCMSYWHSASTTSGYGTPGKRNSQHLKLDESEFFQLSSQVITPNNDGVRDVLQIELTLPMGWVADLIIYDLAGREVRQLANNDLLPTDGIYIWHATDEFGGIVRQGTYILSADLFNLSGGRLRQRWAVSVIHP
jgi:hypothetical protein